MLISLIVGITVAGMTYAGERAIDRTIQQGRAIKKSGGSIRQTIENTAAGMTYAAMQMEPPPVPQPPVRYDADEFDDDDFFCDDCEDIVAEAPAEEPETITPEVIEPEQPAPAEKQQQPRDPESGQFTKKNKGKK